MKNVIILLLLSIVAVGGTVWYLQLVHKKSTLPDTSSEISTSSNDTVSQIASSSTIGQTEVIGKSVEGREILAYHFGSGSKELLVVAGIHGGYEWNTVIVANKLIDFLNKSPNFVPAGMKITVIPVLNPDGLAKVTNNATSFTASDIVASDAVQVSGRFNANEVDLNRNFDCDWKAQGVWQDKTVSGGASVFSEPETKALQSYVTGHTLTGALVYYSSAGGVYASNCHDGVLSDTKKLLSTYGSASGYPQHESFDFYDITGDAVNWMAKKGIPAISILLTNHTDDEWAKNQKGIQAVLEMLAQ